MLAMYGSVKAVDIKYNTFRGSRNLKNRNIHVSEYMFILQKEVVDVMSQHDSLRKYLTQHGFK